MDIMLSSIVEDVQDFRSEGRLLPEGRLGKVHSSEKLFH